MATIIRHENCSAALVPHDLTTSELLHRHQHTLQYLEDSLLTLRALMEAHRASARSPDDDFLDRYEQAMEIFDDSLVSLRTLMNAHGAGKDLSNEALAQLHAQCTAAAVAAAALRRKAGRLAEEDSPRR